MGAKLIEMVDSEFDINRLAEKLGISRSYLNTRFQF